MKHLRIMLALYIGQNRSILGLLHNVALKICSYVSMSLSPHDISKLSLQLHTPSSQQLYLASFKNGKCPMDTYSVTQQTSLLEETIETLTMGEI